MKLRSFFALAIIALFFHPAAADPELRVVTVDGHANISATPDRAIVNMAVQTRHKDMKTARSEVLEVTREFLASTKRLRIDQSKIQTSGLTIRPEYRWNNNAGKQELLGYLVQRQIDVTLEDLDKLGELLEGAVNAGVNQVSPPRLLSSKESELHRRALAAAAKDAELNARQLATTLGSQLGDVREITAVQNNPAPQPLLRQSMAIESSAADSYNTGDIQFQASVRAKFDLLIE